MLNEWIYLSIDYRDTSKNIDYSDTCSNTTACDPLTDYTKAEPDTARTDFVARFDKVDPAVLGFNVDDGQIVTTERDGKVRKVLRCRIDGAVVCHSFSVPHNGSDGWIGSTEGGTEDDCGILDDHMLGRRGVR